MITLKNKNKQNECRELKNGRAASKTHYSPSCLKRASFISLSSFTWE